MACGHAPQEEGGRSARTRNTLGSPQRPGEGGCSREVISRLRASSGYATNRNAIFRSFSRRRRAMAQDPTNGATRGAAGAALALHRFGLGPRPGSIAAIASDPRGAVLAELERPGIGPVDDRGLMSSAASARAAFEA